MLTALGFAQAITETLAAKRTAESAPGVGTYTDAVVVFKTSIESLRPESYNKAVEIYRAGEMERVEIEKKAAAALHEYMEQLNSKGLSATAPSPPNDLPAS